MTKLKPSINARFREFWNTQNPNLTCVTYEDIEQEFRPFNVMWKEEGSDLKFREWCRLKTLNDYQLDFVLEDYPLCLEIDGRMHLNETNIERDRKKSRDLQIYLGYVVLRVNATTVVSSFDWTADLVWESLQHNFGLKRD
tara:strand:- start:1267 stop:1686 length:420 start_codon:yes stop_codon:yes gene_type:complete